MKFAPSPYAVLLIVACLAPTARAAATVQLSFLAPAKYTDVGDGPVQQERTLKDLGDYFEKVGAKTLADGQTLTLALQDIDLAGRPNLFHRSAGDYRILTGRADWPRIRLHWVLQTPGAADRAGDAEIADMNYLDRFPAWRSSEPLAYEKRMIDAWFKTTFARPSP